MCLINVPPMEIICKWVIIIFCVLSVKSNCSLQLSFDLAPSTSKKPPGFNKEGDLSGSDTRSRNEGFKSLANKFAQRLKQFADIELGVPIVKDITSSLEYQITEVDTLATVQQLSERLRVKISSYLKALDHSVSLIEDFKHHSKKLCFVNVPCIYISDKGSYEEIYNSTLDFNNLPLSILNLTEGFIRNLDQSLGKNMQYFISELEPERVTHVFSDSFPEDKCVLMDDPHFQKVFLNTVSPEPKQLVLLLDIGGSLSDNQFAIGKAVASHLINSLSADDRVSLLVVSDSAIAVSPRTTLCSDLTMVRATEPNKHLLTTAIDDLNKSKGMTNHSLGFSLAFATLQQQQQAVGNSSGSDAVIVYISRGLLSSLAEARTVMEAIARGHEAVTASTRVVINTCVLIDDGKAVLYEKYFLSSVAQQNFSQFNMSSGRGKSEGLAGTTVTVNSSSSLGGAVRSLCSLPATPITTSATFSPPQWGAQNTGELVVSVSRAARDKDGQLLGVVGIDIPLQYFADDFTFFKDQYESYSFLMDSRGKAVAHPLLKQPTSIYELPVNMDITVFETLPEFISIKKKILENRSGVHKLENNQVSYSWQRVEGTGYTAVYVSHGPQHTVVWSQAKAAAPAQLLYHRLDLINSGNQHLCTNFRQLATLDAGTVFLSGWCFKTPAAFLQAERASVWSVRRYLAYLSDPTELLANPGLRSSVRAELRAVAASPLLPRWQRQFTHSSLSPLTVRRCLVTASGAVLSYPGGVVSHRLDVLHREWYLRARQYPGQLTVTPSYLDAAGAGYVITLSVAVQSFIISVDFTLGALLRLLVETLPACGESLDPRPRPGYVKCFLLDDRGYLVAHPALTTTATDQQHVTHRESLLANDLLNHKGLVRKLVCNDWTSNTVQRWYQLNTSLDHVVTNVIPGEQCVQYQLTRLPGTNTFLALVNTTCDPVTAFCPCNTIDRHCLNCQRMEQTECECPCECPMETCSASPQLQSTPPPPPCPPSWQAPATPTPLPLPEPSLQPCRPTLCQQFTSHRSCLGVVGCEWCQLEVDGLTPLSDPFCARQALCYSGRLTHASTRVSGSMGPGVGFGGAVFALVTALALMLYCYCRHSVRPAAGYIAPDSSALIFSTEKHLIEPSQVTLASNAQEVNVSVCVSPYRMSCGYRRPPTGDSDHGYSTMTAHEDPEPTPTSPPPTPPTPPSLHQTLLPHRVLAPVTVHMAMES